MRAYPEIPIIERTTMHFLKVENIFRLHHWIEKNRKIIFMAFALKGKVLRVSKEK